MQKQLGDYCRILGEKWWGHRQNDGTSRGDDTVRGGHIHYIFWKLRQRDLLKIISNKLRRTEKSRMIPTFVA